MLSCDFGNLPADPTGAAAIVVNVGGTIDPAATGGFTMRNTARAFDLSGSDVTADEATSIRRSSTFTVTKSTAASNAVAGAPLTWTVTVTNNGPSNADAPIVLDTPDTGYTITSMTVPGGTCDVPTLTCRAGDLGPGATATVTVIGTVSPDRPDGTTITNTATVSSTTPDSNPDNNSDDATLVLVRSSPELSPIRHRATATGSTAVATTATVTVSELAATGWGDSWIVQLGVLLLHAGTAAQTKNPR